MAHSIVDTAMIRLALISSVAVLFVALSPLYDAPSAFAKKGSELRDVDSDHGGKKNDPDDRRTNRDSDDHSGSGNSRGDGKDDSSEGRVGRILTQLDGAASDAGEGTRDDAKVKVRDGDRF
jgi:hypothetical protein